MIQDRARGQLERAQRRGRGAGARLGRRRRAGGRSDQRLARFARASATRGWSLVETTQSLGMLTAALRCPGKPIPADCEQRISDTLKTDRFIFGCVSKGPQDQVTAEVHLFQKKQAGHHHPRATRTTSATRTTTRSPEGAEDPRAPRRQRRRRDRREMASNGESSSTAKHVRCRTAPRIELSPGTHSVEATTKTARREAEHQRDRGRGRSSTSPSPAPPSRSTRPPEVKAVPGVQGARRPHGGRRGRRSVVSSSSRQSGSATGDAQDQNDRLRASERARSRGRQPRPAGLRLPEGQVRGRHLRERAIPAFTAANHRSASSGTGRSRTRSSRPPPASQAASSSSAAPCCFFFMGNSGAKPRQSPTRRPPATSGSAALRHHERRQLLGVVLALNRGRRRGLSLGGLAGRPAKAGAGGAPRAKRSRLNAMRELQALAVTERVCRW